MQVEKHEEKVSGLLYVLPHAQFELHPDDGSATLKGNVEKNCLNQIIDVSRTVSSIVAMTTTVKLSVRQVFLRGRTIKYAYTLLAIDDSDAAADG